MESYVVFKESKKDAVYKEMLPQLRSLLEGEQDAIANLSNTVAVLKMAFPAAISWVGFYFRRGRELVLGPFQGKPACVRIQMGKGVCGVSAEQRKTLIVPDVNAFPGHIFCDPESKSEIVVPILAKGELQGVLDIDSAMPACFDETDQHYLEQIVEQISGDIVRHINNTMQS